MSDHSAELHRYRNSLLAFFLRRTGHISDAEDLVQEVFVRLLDRRGDNGSSDAPSPALVFTIATNLLRDRGRRAAVRARFSETSQPAEEERRDVLTPERVLISKHEAEQALIALSQVAERSRHIFTMFRFEGMSQRQIAEHYGISVSAVEKHVARVLVHLNKKLNR